MVICDCLNLSQNPKAPDPAATAAAQTASDKETAWYNAMLQNMDQITLTVT